MFERRIGCSTARFPTQGDLMRFSALLILVSGLLSPGLSQGGLIISNSVIGPTPAGSIDSISLLNTGDNFVKDQTASLLDLSAGHPDRTLPKSENIFRRGASFSMQYNILSDGVAGDDTNLINFTVTNSTSNYRLRKVAFSIDSQSTPGSVSLDSVTGSTWSYRDGPGDDFYILQGPKESLDPGDSELFVLSLTVPDTAIGESFTLRFDFTGRAIPEPSSFLIASLGLGVFMVGRKRVSKKRCT